MDYLFEYDESVNCISTKNTETDDNAPSLDTFHKWENYERAHTDEIMKVYNKFYKSDYGLSATVQVLGVYENEKELKYDLDKLMIDSNIPVYQAKTNQWVLIHETK